MIEISRRGFLAAAAATGMAAATESAIGEQAPDPARPQVCIFSKHLQFLDYEGLARTTRELGLDGVDLTVRPGGHVTPDKLDDLPRAVDAVRAEGLEVEMITTALQHGADPDARPILEAAKRAGVHRIRIDGGSYSPGDGDPQDEWPPVVEGLRILAEMARDLDLTLGFHNHSGTRRIGAVVWDLHAFLTEVGIDNLGSNFDVAHATVVGGYRAWELHARLMAPHVKMMAVKDFVWDGSKVQWAPLGEGIVDPVPFFRIFRKAGFSGPISLQFEYDIPSEDVLLNDIRTAGNLVRGYLKEAGYA